MLMRAFWLSAALLAGAIGSLSAQKPSAPSALQKLDVAGLPNALQVHARLISGGEPLGDVAFAALKELGVKTILSVDGARPDVELAAKFGLRYVHLPHGYDGISEERARELAKAVRDLAGPIYVHCHHGKHRSPAAAAVACVSAGLIEPSEAPAILKTAGTSEHYRGLYGSAAAARRISDEQLDALAVEFRPVAKVPPMADAMVEIERTHGRLKLLAEAGWQRLAAQPDLEPVHEALLLKEHYRELARTPDAQRQPADFRAQLAQAEKRAEHLESALRTLLTADNRDGLKRADVDFGTVTQDCTRCHQRFRDVPQGEKKPN